MSLQSDLCKILYHDWQYEGPDTYCARCDKGWVYEEDWDEYCKRLSQAEKNQHQGKLLLASCRQNKE